MDRSAAPWKTWLDLAGSTGEEPLDQVAGVGATLIVTATRVAIVRDGANLRPRSGLRAWPHGAVEVRLEAPKHGSGRVALRTVGPTGPAGPREVASVFVAADRWPDAERVAAAIRREAIRVRIAERPDPADNGRPVRPISSPLVPKP